MSNETAVQIKDEQCIDALKDVFSRPSAANMITILRAGVAIDILSERLKELKIAYHNRI